MNPAELILTAGIFLGLAVPMSALQELKREPANMDRFVMRENCPHSERCLVDTEAGDYMGSNVPESLN